MLKFLLFASILSSSFFSLSKLDLKRIKKIKSVELQTEQGAIRPGEDFTVVLKVELLNGAVFYSNLNNRFGFNDFNVTVTGASKNVPNVRKFYLSIGNEVVVESEKKNIKAYENNQLDLKADYGLVNHPYVLVKAQLIEYPQISCELSMPVHFYGEYAFDFSGFEGSSGSHGVTPSVRSTGRNHVMQPAVWRYKEPEINGSDGRDGLTGTFGGHGRTGENGSDVDVFVSLIDCEFENKKLVKVEVSPEKGETYIRYLEKNGRIIINTIGGNGGDGGRGGNGSDGMPGGQGQRSFDPNTGELIGMNNGTGGDGGNGGHGGSGGNAGDGGKGGDVNIFLEEEAQFFKYRIQVNNYGGEAGKPGGFGVGGYGGLRGDGGKGKANNGSVGKRGLNGYSGKDGAKGEVNYIIWN